jgi:hypothetical protein
VFKIKKSHIKIFAPIILLAAIIAFYAVRPAQGSFEAEVKKCNSFAKNLVFSCYRSSMEKYFAGDPSKITPYLRDDKRLTFDHVAKDGNISYAVFGTNCHTFYHAAGDFVASHSDVKNLKSLIDDAPLKCTNGYTMGLYKRFAIANNFDMDLLSRFWTECKKGVEVQCAHEIGHLLQDKNFYPLLKLVDDISTKEFGIVYPQKYNYDYAKEVNFDAPFEECEELIPDNNKVAQCYTGIGHNQFIFSEFAGSYKEQFDNCKTASDENVDYCLSFLIFRIGINHAATQFLSNKFDEGIKVCESSLEEAGRPDLAEHCYVGIGGGIGLFIDSEYAIEKVTDENAEAISKQLLDFAKLCRNAPEDYVDKCLAGLMGTKFAKFYSVLKLNDERIEKIRSTLDSDFEVVG